MTDRYIAAAGEDFEAQPKVVVDFAEGQQEALLNITVLADDVPELWEHFQVAVTGVELLGPYPTPTNIASPRVSDQTAEFGAHVIIAANDEPFGHFVVSSTQSTTSVLEEDGANITLVVDRQGGAFETSVVDWTSVSPNAQEPDTAPLTGALTFEEGVVQRNVSVRVINDETPELDETVAFQLAAATNDATFDPAPWAVVILSNDDAAGRFRVSPGYESVTGAEGASATVLITRTHLFGGRVEVSWSLSAISRGARVGADVASASGAVMFLPEQKTAPISIPLVDDDLPEAAEAFRLTLDAVSVPGASLLANHTSAVVTIAANDDTYGVVGFAAASMDVLVNERSRDVVLSIERSRGAFAAVSVRVRTRAVEGEVVNADGTAEADVDYISLDTVVDIGVNETSATVAVSINDDADPELSEAFVVEIVSVERTDLQVPDVPSTPRIATDAAVAVITINSNDDAGGVFSFTTSEATVQEGVSANLSIVRTGGALGAADLLFNYYDGPGVAGARRSQDYAVVTTRCVLRFVCLFVCVSVCSCGVWCQLISSLLASTTGYRSKISKRTANCRSPSLMTASQSSLNRS